MSSVFRGSIQLIVGPMFSGKTSELLRLMRRQLLAGKSAVLVKFAWDLRFGDSQMVVSHDLQQMEAVSALRLADVYDEISTFAVVGIDEGQFFDDIAVYAEMLANEGIIVIIAALDSDFERKPFTSFAPLFSLSEFFVKLTAVCQTCGGTGAFTHRTLDTKEQKIIGGSEIYKAMCRRCFMKANPTHSFLSSI